MPTLRSQHGFACLVFVFGLCINDVLRSSIASVARDLDVLDGFSGEGAMHKSAAQQGFRAEAFDKFRIPGVTDLSSPCSTEDLTLEAGFQRVLRLVLRLRRGGLLIMGPPCSSFVMLNAKNCKRHQGNDFRGDEGYKPVQVGNLLATVSAFLMVLAYMRGVHVVIENPPGSTIWKYSPMKEAIQICGGHSAVTPRCAWSAERLGKRMKKYFRFCCSAPWIQKLRRKCPCGGRGHLQLTVIRFVNGRKRFTGKRVALLKSAAYPLALGRAIIKAWSQSSNDLHSVLRSAGDGCTCHWLTTSPGSASTTSQKPRGRIVRKRKQPEVAWLCPPPCSTKSHKNEQEPAWTRPSPSSSPYQKETGSPAWLQPSPGTSRS